MTPIFLDVNVCIHAMRADMASVSPAVQAWLQGQVDSGRSILVAELVLSALIRITTNASSFSTPSTPTEAVDFANALVGAPSVRVARPTTRHWAIFCEFVTSQSLRGRLVPDAYLASMALDAGAAMATLDRGFYRFPGLRVVDPLA